MKEFIKKVSWVVLANVASMIVSAMITVILPKYVSVEEYGIWQMYMLYITYIGCIHFGLPDGIYLRYSGQSFGRVINNNVKYLFWISCVWEIAICSGIYFATLTSRYSSLSWAYFLCGCVYVPSLYLKYLLLASNRMKEYSSYVLLEKCVLLIALILPIVFSDFSIYKFVGMDLFGKTIAFLFALYICRDIFRLGKIQFKVLVSELRENIKAGACLMISTVSSNFIVGSIRLFIEKKWTIEVFSKVSLSLQITNFVLAFVRAISLPLFPVIRNKNKEDALKIYKDIRMILVLLIIVLFAMYYPMAFVLKLWLPNYRESVDYLGVLFPICLFEAKQALLCETYLKNYRKEKYLLAINVICMLVSIGLGWGIIFIFENRMMSIYFILIILCIRSTVSEIYLSILMQLNLVKEIITEIVIVLIFLVCNISGSLLRGFIIYSVILIIYSMTNKPQYAKMLKKIRRRKNRK